MDKMKKKKQQDDPKGGNAIFMSVSPLKALILHLICGVGLGLAFWVAEHIYAVDLITHPSQTLRLISVFVAPIVILLYSHLRHDRSQCSYVKAIGRGLLALPAGAVVNAAGATILGAPVGFEYFPKTLNWSLLMSLLTFVPAACVFGSSWTDWHRVFAKTKTNGSTDCMICLPAHGAVIGAWFGAWPMPLDWESPWQEWPICVTYGAIAGYLVGLLASLGCIFFRKRQQYLKEE
ncbi:glycosylphosphatidylinositol anchor biosynthesis protein 11 isoform X2 [Nicotiana sylvestris]|uniref:Glycosylphosphatidylinositol anchor biosynthesis protein 11 n=1 Tax=Nicotiana sylvestris TaxID=4096 RepID=A0A1U7WZ21_NICSY|nr:PREDICTED: glycosylphosphatidylinositol anchor biosynthesis protein 11 [Nicotiana sylvestris]